MKDCRSSDGAAGYSGSLLSPINLLPFESVEADILFSLKTDESMEPCHLKLHYR